MTAMSPKPFSGQEKEMVKSKLIDAAEKSLATAGIRKTSVDELARAAGISKGAFYLFYDSKELLFLDALEREQARIHEAILARVAQAHSPKDGFVTAVVLMYRDFIAKPWLLSFTGEDYEILLRRIPQERIQQHIELDDASTRRLQALLGERANLQPEVLSAALRLLFLGTLHRKEVGEEQTDAAFEFLVQAIADKLFQEEKND
jgi:AcrR family transcriptional regulator